MKICVKCCKRYKTTGNNQKVCLKCRAFRCIICGENCVPNRQYFPKRKCCSLKCRKIYLSRFPNKGVFRKGHFYIKPRIPWRKINPEWGVLIKCAYCKKEKRIKKYRLSKLKNIYCSVLCRGLGYIVSKETRRKMSGNAKRLGLIPPTREIFPRLKKKCLVCNKDFVVLRHRKKAVFCSNICRQKGTWENDDWKEKKLTQMTRSLWNRPTNLEKQMMNIIKHYDLPYKYTGDFSFWIGGKNPDFVNINGEKKLIEVGNVFHHQGDYIEERRKHFARYGWKSYIFIGDKLDKKEILNILEEKEVKII